MNNTDNTGTAAAVMVGPGSTVTLNFALRLESGEAVDSTFDTRPAELTVGDGNLPEGFEQCLLGLFTGAHQVFKVPPERAFGQPNESNIQRVSRDRFAADMELAEGLVMSFADPAGGELPGVVSSYDEDTVTVDFNHPLAGKTLDFEVEILAVKAPETATESTAEATL